MKNNPELATRIDTTFAKYLLKVKPESKSASYSKSYFASWVAGNTGPLVVRGTRFTTTVAHDTVKNTIVINTKFNGIDTTINVATRIIKPPNTFVNAYYKLLNRTRFTTGLLLGAFCIVTLLLTVAVGLFFLGKNPATGALPSTAVGGSLGLFAWLLRKLRG